MYYREIEWVVEQTAHFQNYNSSPPQQVTPRLITSAALCLSAKLTPQLQELSEG
jgi:hypothetical protein